MLDTSSETKSHKRAFSFFSPNTVATGSDHKENPTYAAHTIITTKLPEATDDPTQPSSRRFLNIGDARVGLVLLLVRPHYINRVKLISEFFFNYYTPT